MQIREMLEWGPLATPLPDRHSPVYSWFPYRESFSRELVMRILRMLGAGEGLVLDPFCGAGTTMLACRETGINSVGFDAHPLAVFVSRVKLGDYDRMELLREMKRVLESGFVKPKLRVTNRLLKKGFPKGSLEETVFYRDLIMQARDKGIRDFLLLGLMEVAMKCSYIRKDGAVLRVRKRNVPFPRKVLKSRLNRMLKDLDRIRFRKSRVRADFGDARRLGLADNVSDFVITSPPYLNKREYEKVFAVEQGLFLDMIGFGPHSNYIGSDIRELEKDSARLLNVLGDAAGRLPKTANAYFMDMLQAIEEMHRVCKPGAKLAIVVGNGCFPSGAVESDVILSRMAESVGFQSKGIYVLNKRWCTKERTKKVGIARESLLIWEK
jgi:DNA modification methylase